MRLLACLGRQGISVKLMTDEADASQLEAGPDDQEC